MAAVAAAATSPLLASGAGLPHLSSAGAGAAGARLRRVGVQLWTVRQEMARDFEGTLARIAAIGYREVEFENYFGRTAQQVRDSVRSHGLTAPASHITFERLRDEPEKVMEEAHTAGHEYVVFRWLEEKDRNADGYARVIETLNRAGQAAHQAGLVLTYHNHDFELKPLPDGKRPYDLILERTDPALVRMELDVFWLLQGGGQKPVDYFRRWPGRFPLLHLKDMDAAGKMVDVGQGVFDFAALLANRRLAGVRHVFAEHDEPADPWQTLTNSYSYLSKLTFRDA